MDDLSGLIKGLLLLFGLYGIITGGFCAWLAAEKRRLALNWFVLGFLFGAVALLALVGAPELEEAEEDREEVELRRIHISAATLRKMIKDKL